jgi:hypothetical protein
VVVFPIGNGFGIIVFFEYSFFPNGVKQSNEDIALAGRLGVNPHRLVKNMKNEGKA